MKKQNLEELNEQEELSYSIWKNTNGQEKFMKHFIKECLKKYLSVRVISNGNATPEVEIRFGNEIIDID